MKNERLNEINVTIMSDPVVEKKMSNIKRTLKLLYCTLLDPGVYFLKKHH